MVQFLGRTQSSAKLNSSSPSAAISNTHPSQQTPLFEIRLSNTPHDVLVLKGPSSESPSVLLSGTIVLSLNEPLNIRKLSLKLSGTLRMKWINQYETSRGTVLKKPYRWEKKIYEHNWNEIDLNVANATAAKTGVRSGKSSGANSAGSSTTSLKGLINQTTSSNNNNGGKKTKSSTNLASMFSSTASLASLAHTGNGSSSSGGGNSGRTLPQGNYEFPFSTILPGSSMESVEGLPGSSLVYKLQAHIERGRFSNDITTRKHIRIVRTFTPDSLELSETMAVDNTWPKKVEYTISIPTRAVAIGSATPINVTMVPLCKGLRLGKVKVSLQEHYSCIGSFGPPHAGERTISELVVPSSDQDVNEDRWEINSILSIPPSLAKCTQDVDILSNVKVRHKLKFVIGLINPDGHVSELRASLPIVLFISPFVALAVKNMDKSETGGANDTVSEFNDIPSDDEAVITEDDVIFSADPELSTSSLAGLAGNANGGGNLEGFTPLISDFDKEAPPNYGSHIYDRLWSEVASLENSPDLSRAVSPAPGTPLVLAGNSGENLNARNVAKFTENLRRLHLQQQVLHDTPSLDSIANNLSSRLPQAGQEQDQQEEEDEEEDEEEGGLSFAARRDPKRAANNHSITTPINEVASASDYFASQRIPQQQQPPSQTILPSSYPLVSPGVSSPHITHLSRAASTTNFNQAQDFSMSASPPASLQRKNWDSVSMSQVPSYQTAMKSSTNLPLLSPSYDGNSNGNTSSNATDYFSGSHAAHRNTSEINLAKPRSLHLKSTNSISMLRNSSSSSNLTMASSGTTNSTTNHEIPHSFLKPPLLSRPNSKSVLSSSFNASMTPLSTGNAAGAQGSKDTSTTSSHTNKSTSFVNLFGLHRSHGK
ncbi:hypothetical protein WICPIJ_001961 [Wickerhamomyces pijperi]|uniref:Arrestin C-terminal-like domain-containing protein n=1 Tax=Wickerhamomyces pijperi TaxID=599730 RepID=A0A9P8TPD8_WICPI|nr:hypothetical protein WICPIJ_001961 [Wickerhamomyces pijperi]